MRRTIIVVTAVVFVIATVAFAQANRNLAEPAKTPVIWEYQTLALATALPDGRPDRDPLLQLQSRLAAAGKDAWELVSVAPVGDGRGNERLLVVMKRRRS